MSALPAKIKARLSTKSKYGIVLLIIFGIALALRVSLPYENVFMGDGVRFSGNDPWYHMRLIENLVEHFPHRIVFDPYTLYPSGQNVLFAPFFDLLLGFIIWVIGLGSPTQHTIETVGAYFPAILGALVTVPVYFIGRELFNRNVGLLSAGLIATLPGQFLGRSLLGFTDHHIAEVLFSATAALFLILAIKRAKESEISFSHIRSKDWGNLKKPLIYALLAGLALGIYLDTWVGGLLFIFIIFTYVVIQYIIDHLRGKSTDYLCIIGVPMFLVALIMVIPFLGFLSTGELVIASFTTGMLAFPVLSGISRLMAYNNLKRAYYPIALAVIGVVSIALLYLIDPSLYHSAVSRFAQVFIPSETAQTIAEVRSLFSLSGFIAMVSYFTTNIFLALIALGLLIYAGIKERSLQSTLTFLVIWSLIMLLAMLGQNRFSYYFAVNVALLAGYSCWRILQWSYLHFKGAIPERGEGMSELTESEKQDIATSGGPEISISSYLNIKYFLEATWSTVYFLFWGKRKGEQGKETQEKEPGRSIIGHFIERHARVVGMTLMVFLIAFMPNIALATTGEFSDPKVPNEAWYSSLLWMSDTENTPDPFEDLEDPDFYYELYEGPPAGERYEYPESAYGIMNFWDYGHWITRIAHRIPSANPFQAGARTTARFFVAQDESSANEVLDKLESTYIIIDNLMATGIFNAIAIWAEESEEDFLEIYYRDPDEGEAGFKIFYYPEYYRSMCSRLYNFNGEAVIPHNSTVVISFEEETTFLGGAYKQISSTQTFATYEEAQEYLDSQTDPNYRIVGIDPFASPVPLEELEHYQLRHQSEPEVLTKKKEDPLPFVKIFEYLP